METMLFVIAFLAVSIIILTTALIFIFGAVLSVIKRVINGFFDIFKIF